MRYRRLRPPWWMTRDLFIDVCGSKLHIQKQYDEAGFDLILEKVVDRLLRIHEKRRRTSMHHANDPRVHYTRSEWTLRILSIVCGRLTDIYLIPGMLCPTQPIAHYPVRGSGRTSE